VEAEGFGDDGGGRVAEPDVNLAVVAVGDVADGRRRTRLGAKQHEGGGSAEPGGGVVVGDVAAQQGEAAVLGDGFAFGEAELGEWQAGMWRPVMAQGRKLRATCFW
jgi:hypothetical protein